MTKKGYTLIELLVTLSIVGLLFGFSYSSFRDFSRRQALSGSSKKIQGDLRLAQQQSLSGKKPSGVKCDSPSLLQSFSFNVYSSNAYKIEANCSGGDILVKDVLLPTGIQIQAPSINPIKFKVLGQGTNIAVGTSVDITVSQTGTNNQSIVTVSSAGEIK